MRRRANLEKNCACRATIITSKNVVFALFVALAIAFALAPVTLVGQQYELNSSGTWTSVSGGRNVTGVGTNEVRWGWPAGSQKSGYRFDGETGVTFDPGEEFSIGTFTHFNHPIYHGTGANGATLQVALHFINPTTSPDPTFTYYFDHEETPNVPNGCPWWQESSTPCDDRVTFPNAIAEETFWIDGVEYTLQITGFKKSVSGPIVEHFITEEYKDNSAELYARMLVCAPDISIEKLTNGENADDAPGPHIPIGDPVEWTYEVQNTGNVTLTGITVVDDNGTPGDSADDITICSGITLDPGDSSTFTASGTAVAGQYGNIATATGDYDGHTYSDTDPSHYYGFIPDCADYDVEYLEASFNGTNTSFTYRVSANSSPAVSHWVLALDTCIEKTDIVSATEPWEFGTDPKTGLRGIKIDNLNI